MPPLETEDVEQIKTLFAESLKEATPEILKAIGEETTKTIDSRINKAFDPVKLEQKLLDRIGKGSGKADDDESKGKSNGGLTDRDRAMLRRSLKQAIKDEAAELPEGIRYHVRDMALAAADRVGLDLDSDEDAIAKEMVEAFKGTVERAKTSFEEGLRTDLKARKLLLDDDKSKQPPGEGDGGGGNETDPKKLFDKGAALAKERFGEKKE